MPLMKNPKKSESKSRRTGISTHVYLDPAVDAALTKYLDTAVPAVSKTAAVQTAVIEFLRARGHWPHGKPDGV